MLGRDLRTLRRKAGLTQEQVAARSGITREYVSMLEAGKYMPTIEVFVRLCWAVNITPAELITRVERNIRDE